MLNVDQERHWAQFTICVLKTAQTAKTLNFCFTIRKKEKKKKLISGHIFCIRIVISDYECLSALCPFWFLVSYHGVKQPATLIDAWHFVVPGQLSRCKATRNSNPCLTLCVPGHFSRCKATSNIHPCMTLCVPGHFSRCKATSNINPCVTRLRSKHEHESARMPNVTARLVVWMYIYETSNTWTERQLNGDINVYYSV